MGFISKSLLVSIWSFVNFLKLTNTMSRNTNRKDTTVIVPFLAPPPLPARPIPVEKAFPLPTNRRKDSRGSSRAGPSPPLEFQFIPGRHREQACGHLCSRRTLFIYTYQGWNANDSRQWWIIWPVRRRRQRRYHAFSVADRRWWLHPLGV